MKTEETEKEIIHYFDIEEMFQIGLNIIERFREDPSPFMWLGIAEDLFANKSEFAITSDQKIIMEAEGELYELDTAPMNIMEEGNPLAEFMSPLGLPEILSDIQQIFRNLSDEN